MAFSRMIFVRSAVSTKSAHQRDLMEGTRISLDIKYISGYIILEATMISICWSINNGLQSISPSCAIERRYRALLGIFGHMKKLFLCFRCAPSCPEDTLTFEAQTELHRINQASGLVISERNGAFMWTHICAGRSVTLSYPLEPIVRKQVLNNFTDLFRATSAND